MIYGYARVSTIEQTTAQQQLALEQYGCDRILLEHGISGSTIERNSLSWLLNNVVAGDTVVVVRLDRLGRSLKHLIETIEYFGKSGVNFVSIAEGFDTKTATGKLLFHVFGAFAEFERNLIIERTNAGINSAKIRGVQFGQPLKLNQPQQQLLIELRNNGKSPKEICRLLNISPATYYRYVQRNLLPLINN